MSLDELNNSQVRALHKYIKDGYIIIDSGRESGKTYTLCNIINIWRDLQANNYDHCIVICKSPISVIEMKEKLIKLFVNDLMYVNLKNTKNGLQLYTIDGKTVIIHFVVGIDNYFYYKNRGNFNGINVSLLVGDECYIEPSLCRHTACAYTQANDVVSLSYDGLISKEEIEYLKCCMSKKDFDRNYGQYL